MSANSLKIAETTKVQAAATVVAKDETPKTTKFQGNELIREIGTTAKGSPLTNAEVDQLAWVVVTLGKGSPDETDQRCAMAYGA